jgi:hypothetical protein
MADCLLEIVQSKNVQVDKTAGVVRGVRVLGLESLNGRRYAPEAVRRARSLYEGQRVNYDHPPRESPDKERSIGDRAGWLSNIREDSDGGLSGDLNLLLADGRAAKVMEAAERKPDLFGLSHNAEGRTRREGDKVLVEEILSVKSVDIVSDPATTRSLFESIERKPPMKKTVKQVADAHKSHAYMGRLAKLLEQEDMAAMGAMEVDAPAEDPNAEIAAAFEKAGMSILKKIFAGDMDVAEGMKKIKEILGQKDKAAGDSETPAAPEPAPTQESVQARVKQLEAEIACRDLLESEGVKFDAVKAKALASLPAGDRKALVESWKGVPGQERGPKPESTPLRETAGALPKDPEAFLRSLKR